MHNYALLEKSISLICVEVRTNERPKSFNLFLIWFALLQTKSQRESSSFLRSTKMTTYWGWKRERTKMFVSFVMSLIHVHKDNSASASNLQEKGLVNSVFSYYKMCVFGIVFPFLLATKRLSGSQRYLFKLSHCTSNNILLLCIHCMFSFITMSDFQTLLWREYFLEWHIYSLVLKGRK